MHNFSPTYPVLHSCSVSWVILSSCFQLSPICLISVSKFVLSQTSLLLTWSIHVFENFPQALLYKCLGTFQCCLVDSPCFCSVQQHILDICVEQTVFRCFADYPGLPRTSQYVECCFADSCLYVSLKPPIPPRVSTMLLRFLNDSTSSPSSMIGLSQEV